MTREKDTVWAPDACTLPTVQRPLRVAEFDRLFTDGLWRQTRVSPVALTWSLKPELEVVARNLAARETACCSFFTFAFESDGDELTVTVRVPAAQVDVLTALADRAAARMAAA